MMQRVVHLLGAGSLLILGATMLALVTSTPQINASLAMGPSDTFAIDLLIPYLGNPLEEAIRLSVGAPVPDAMLPEAISMRPGPVFWALLGPYLAISGFVGWRRWQLQS